MEVVFVAFKAGDVKVFNNVLGNSIKIPESGKYLTFIMEGGEAVIIMLDSVQYIVEKQSEESNED